MGLFRTLLIIVLFFYAFNLIIKFIFKHKIKKLERSMEQYTQGETQPVNDEAKNPHVDPNIGEYTDFEEIEN